MGFELVNSRYRLRRSNHLIYEATDVESRSQMTTAMIIRHLIKFFKLQQRCCSLEKY